jgi:ribosome-associated translation inhibitor RaiA
VLSVNGRIRVVRKWWYGPKSGSVAPVDGTLDRRADSITPGVRELCCRLNQSASSFDKAADNLHRAAQVSLSGEQLRLIVEGEGRAVLAAQHAIAVPTAWKAGDCRTEAGKTRIYTGCDGVMVPLVTEAEKEKRRQKVREKRRRGGRKCRPLPPRRKGADQSYKEFKVVLFYDEGSQRQHVAVTAGNHRAAGKLMRREASRLRFHLADERVANVDGATWIRNQMQENLADLHAIGLDFYHLGENVHRARRSVFGEESPEGKTWADELMHVFKHEGYDAAWDRLASWRAGLGRSRKRKAADRLLNYVSDRREMIRYPEFRARQWQIGSGPTESQCRLTVERLKHPGQRWDRRNAEAVAALGTLDRSGQWQSYWRTPIPATP